MEIAKFEKKDIEEVVSLFYDTVHIVNGKDYSVAQLEAWAPREEQWSNINKWLPSLEEHITFVAKKDQVIIGFADMSYDGYLDRLYVHHAYQGQGVATALVERLEEEAIQLQLYTIETDASITAKPFFEQRGYRTVRPQIAMRRGVELDNYHMIKQLVD